MNCYNGCKYAKVEINDIVCHYLDTPMVVHKSYFECKFFEQGKNSELDLEKFEKDVK